MQKTMESAGESLRMDAIVVEDVSIEQKVFVPGAAMLNIVLQLCCVHRESDPRDRSEDERQRFVHAGKAAGAAAGRQRVAWNEGFSQPAPALIVDAEGGAKLVRSLLIAIVNRKQILNEALRIAGTDITLYTCILCFFPFS
jgi:hypothetical protein